MGKRKMLALDQRSGRLERAVMLLEDGVIRGLKVHRREADPPLLRPLNVGPDRATLKLTPYRESERGRFTFTPGYWGQSDLTRQGMPAITLSGIAKIIATPVGGSLPATFDATGTTFDGTTLTWDATS
jgi:hypothetical protein